MNFDIPEEDKHLESPVSFSRCAHEWCDLYGGMGVSKTDPLRALMTFFCKRCLKIVTKSYDQSMYKLREEEDESGL